ncbi:MAG: histidine kinase [Bacteroidia bacterium]|nr:histidine kinase [Bacteroidia bacterium]
MTTTLGHKIEISSTSITKYPLLCTFSFEIVCIPLLLIRILDQEINILPEKRAYRYWTYQLLGWGLASIYWAYIVYVNNDYSVLHTLVNFIFDVLIGISLTHTYKLMIHNSGRISFSKGSVLQLAIAIILLSVSFMLLVNAKWYIYWTMIKAQHPDFLASMLFWDPPLITGLRLMTIWVLAYHLYHYHKQQIALTKHNAELSVLAKQIQIDQLSNQLNPHFLFNALNSVKSLIAESPQRARRSIDLLSDLLRSSLYTKGNLQSLEDELQLINDYIELEKIRFEERLQLQLSIADDVDLTYKIPALSIQLLIENALKHGIQNSIAGGCISLSINKKIEYLEIIVQNPGRLKLSEESQNTALGIKNLRQRLQLQYQEKAAFELIEKPKGFVNGTIRIPLT